jgi:hypothetical protein
LGLRSSMSAISRARLVTISGVGTVSSVSVPDKSPIGVFELLFMYLDTGVAGLLRGREWDSGERLCAKCNSLKGTYVQKRTSTHHEFTASRLLRRPF